MNEVSSRSHCILTVYVEGLNKLTNLRSFGKLHLVWPATTLKCLESAFPPALPLTLCGIMHPPSRSQPKCKFAL
jgi:hypothetical protein